MVEIYRPTEHKISIGIGIIKKVVQNRGNPLDVIREALSNSCAKEVGASYFKIAVFYDGGMRFASLHPNARLCFALRIHR